MKLSLTILFSLFCSISAWADCGTITLTAVSDGVTDTAPAWRSSLDELAKCGGGTLTIPAGKFALRSEALKNFQNLAGKIIIRGNGSSSQVFINTGGLTNGLVLQNVDSLIEGITFIGGGIEGAQTQDALNAILIQGGRSKFQHDLFVGIGSGAPGAATIRFANGAFGTIEDSQFWACRSNSGQSPYTGTVVFDKYGGARVRRNKFLDYSSSFVNGLYYETGSVAGMAWILFLDPLNTLPPDPLTTTTVVIEDNEFDEGAYAAVAAVSGIMLYRMELNRNSINVGVGGGYLLSNIEYLTVNGGFAGLHTGNSQVNAIQLQNVHYATIRDFKTASNTFANRLFVDAGTKMLRLIDSPFPALINNAQAWRIENGATVTSYPSVKPIRKL